MQIARKTLLALISTALAAAISSVGCGGPTQVVVDFRTDAPAGTRISFSVYEGPAIFTSQAVPITTHESVADSTGSLGTFTFIPPDGDSASRLWLTIVVAQDGANPGQCYLTRIPCATHRRVVQYIPGRTVLLTLPLAMGCTVAPSCGDGETCSPSTLHCVSARVDCSSGEECIASRELLGP